MSYQETINNHHLAEAAYGKPREAAKRLPLSEWAEAVRDLMTPRTIAANHALHVADCAHELRKALREAEETDNPIARLAALADVEDAARALLAAIGEAGE